MIAKYNRQSLIVGAPGILLHFGGWIGVTLVSAESPGSPLQLITIAIALLGTILLMAGLGLYARAKGRSPAWGVFGFLGLIGLLILALLKDLTPNAIDPTHIQNRNTLARLSVYCGLFGILPLLGFITCPVGLILGGLGLKNARKHGGRGTAIAGLSLCTLFLLLWAGLIAVAIWSDTRPQRPGTQRPSAMQPQR